MSKCIHELDGLPQAYMEVWGDDRTCVRIRYRTVSVWSWDPDSCRHFQEAFMDRLKSELPDGAIIWWRKRPEEKVEWVQKQDFAEKPPKPRYFMMMRLETTPHLPAAFWNEKFETHTGCEARRI